VALGLLHYLDYRPTHDVDAWWVPEATSDGRLLTSPVYHLLRDWHGLPALPYLGRELAHIRDDPSLEHI
jgi:hypothetical protein